MNFRKNNTKPKPTSRLLLYFLLGLSVMLISNSPFQEYPPGEWDTIIENQEFTAPLTLEEGDNNVLIINSTFRDFKGDAITLRNVSNIYIKNCKIQNIDGNGIVLRSTGKTNRVTIDGCTIQNTTKNGIIAKQDYIKEINHSQLTIKYNILENNGADDLDHSIYVQSQDSIIENNEIHKTSGNGISIRSSGILRGNKIWEAEKSCIRYFNDNLPGPSNTLLIENNICYQTLEGSQAPGISLLAWDQAPLQSTVGNFIIRFNTIVMFTNKRVGIDIESAHFAPKRIVVYGNIVINTQDIGATILEDHIDYLSKNYISTSTDGFVNLQSEPFDFHITELSPAAAFANNEIDFPRTDADGEARSINRLDAGAYQLKRNRDSNTSIFSEDTDVIKYTTRRVIGFGLLSIVILLLVVYRKQIFKRLEKLTD